jgi:ribosomal protein S18 acetylase RimI-like enzyme
MAPARGPLDETRPKMEGQHMAHLTNRWYRDERDLKRMLALIAASMRQDGLEAGHFHAGDIVWGLFQNLTIDPATRIRLFEDGRGALRGFVWLHPPREFGVHVNTAMAGFPDVVSEMVRWAESHLGAERMALPEVPADGEWLKPVLVRAGYRPTGESEFRLNAQEPGDIPAPTLPEGGVVRAVPADDVGEIVARVALHCEVWESSKFSVDGYARLRRQPVYRPDLDLVAVTPAGELASYGMVWWDPATRTGEFEPVGTSARFRRQGYGRAVLLEGLRRLRALGAERALVICAIEGEKWEPSRRLYASVGFDIVTQFDEWEKAG